MLETDMNHYLPSSKSRQKPVVAVCSLRPLSFVNVSGVCESVLYGIPRIVKPTSCWKIEWEELENNQSYFNSLNQYMKEKVRGFLCSILWSELCAS